MPMCISDVRPRSRFWPHDAGSQILVVSSSTSPSVPFVTMVKAAAKTTAKKVAKASEKVGRTACEMMSVIENSALAQVTEYLEQHPEEILQALHMLQTGMCKRATKAKKENTLDIAMSRSRLHLVASNTMANCVAMMNKKLVPYMEGELCSDENDIARKLFHMGTNTEPDYGVHEHEYSKFSADYVRRYEAFGKRLHNIPASLDENTFPWDKFGIYEKIVQGERIAQIRHRPSGQIITLPPRYEATPSWKIDANWSEVCAKLVDPDDCDSVVVSTLFAKKHGKSWAPKPVGECIVVSATTTARKKKQDDTEKRGAGLLVRLGGAKKRSRISTNQLHMK